MNLGELCAASVRLGAALDVRGKSYLDEQLRRRREEYAGLPEWQRRYYDTERFVNPFGDVRLIYGSEDTEITSIMLGIDIHVGELLLADRLRAKGTRIDAVIGHHGHGLGRPPSLVDDIMPVNVDMLVEHGVARSAAEKVIAPYIEEKLDALEDFHRLGPDTARLLDLPLACIHTPADYYMRVGVNEALDRARPETIADLVPALLTIPEVDSVARQFGVLPQVMSGDPAASVGPTMLKFGGGYILPPPAYPLLGAAGVTAVIQIACTPAHAAAADGAGVSIIRIPHTAADNIGINLLLDDIEKEFGRLEVIGCGGFERVHR